MEPIKILYLIDKLVPAGTQTNLLEIVKRLDRSKFDPRVIALLGGGELEGEFEAAGVEPILLKVGKVYGPSGWKALSYLTKYMKKEKIDIVQTFFLHADILGSLAAKFARVRRVVMSRRDEGFWRSRRQLILNRTFNRYAKKIVVNSMAVREAVRKNEQVGSRRIHLIYNGVDLDKYFPSPQLRDETRSELGIKEDEFVVGMIANMRHEVKGHRYLIKAFALVSKEIPNVKLMLIGDGPLEAKLEGYAFHLGVSDRILFLGSRRDITPLVNAMDLVCAPSLSEGFSNTILEAMAIGKPIIATNVGGNPEVIFHGETGFLVRPRDGKAIAQKILFLIQNDLLRTQMGDAARKRIEANFTAQKMTKEYEDFFEKLMIVIPERKRAVASDVALSKEYELSKTLLSRKEDVTGKLVMREEKQLADGPTRKTLRSSDPSGAPQHKVRYKTRRFRVLYLIWSLDLGGAEQVVMDLARKLNKQDFKPVICCLNEKGRYAPILEREGIKVFALDKKPKFDPWLLPKLIRLIKDERIDLIHTHLFTANLWGRLAAKFTGTPVIASEHGMDRWRTKFHTALDRSLVKTAKKIVFVSEAVRQFYVAKNPSLNGKSRVIHNGIDVAHFQKPLEIESVRKSLGLNHQEKVIGIVGRLVPEKAHVDFVEAIQLLSEEQKDILGLIVGEGELLELLKGQVEETGLQKHILFAGFRSDLATLYKAMDVLVLCSLREGFPLTILEGMAAGVPIVATSVGGVGELIKDREDGVLVPPGNPAALAQAISNVLSDHELKRRIVQAAQEKVQKYFSVEKMVKDHERLYAEVLGS
ncbi:MAG: GT4 family glycosyltransferase PelF [Candidatus Omnitrophica bacterium]|nr:GT4 family glycosyltransferase PelF [Candidatus Omnitrophota bacterium]